jgi:thioredoxin 1
MSELTITSSNFEELVLKSEKPVLLDFWATWCGPCQMIAPTIHEISEERTDIVVGKVNVDEEMQLAMQFGISSIPTLLLFKDGKLVNQAVGLLPKASVLKFIDG